MDLHLLSRRAGLPIAFSVGLESGPTEAYTHVADDQVSFICTEYTEASIVVGPGFLAVTHETGSRDNCNPCLHQRRRRSERWSNGRYGHICNHRSEEHTSELQSLMRISYAVFCLKKKTDNIQ